jgi:hypothetical protein
MWAMPLLRLTLFSHLSHEFTVFGPQINSNPKILGFKDMVNLIIDLWTMIFYLKN